jgi:hypothetical protein
MLDFLNAVLGSGVLFDIVLSAVQRCKATKMPLTPLCIDHCVISTDEASKLETVVREFRWGHEGGNARRAVAEMTAATAAITTAVAVTTTPRSTSMATITRR